VYKHLKEDMKFLWSKDLRINTVHVRDVCRALMLVAEKAKPGSIYNLADPNDSSTYFSSIKLFPVCRFPSPIIFLHCEPFYLGQETIASILREIYSIKTDYQGSIISNFAMVMLIFFQGCFNLAFLPIFFFF